MFGKLFVILFVGFVNLYAYKVGDSLDSRIIKKLDIKSDKTYVIDFFASWCASCKIELPLIAKLNNNLDKSQFEIIGINVDENIKDGKYFVKKLNLNFDITYDYDNQIIAKFNPIGVPAIYYVKNLKVIKVIYGAVHNIDQKILSDLRQLGK